MLAIQHRLIDRLKNVKAITAGTVAFCVGLTGAAAYVGSGLVYDNFSYEFADPKTSGKVAGASTTAETKTENGEAGMPGSGNGSTALSTDAATSQNSGSTGVTVAPSGGSIVGGRGAGTTSPTVTIPPVTEPAPAPVIIVPPAPDPTNCLCSVIEPVTNTGDSTVDVVVDGLGL